MEKKPDIEEIIFNTFRNAAETYELYQKEGLEKLRSAAQEMHSRPPTDRNSKTDLKTKDSSHST